MMAIRTLPELPASSDVVTRHRALQLCCLGTVPDPICCPNLKTTCTDQKVQQPEKSYG